MPSSRDGNSTEPDNRATPPAPERSQPNAASAEPATALLLRSTRYEPLELIGRGGMGIVYRARHRALDKVVALKVLLPGRSPERFLHEAQLLARIRSPHVVQVHDFEVLPDGSRVLAMEWVDGCDLRRLLHEAGGPLPEERVHGWMRDVCIGMTAAADCGIIHRDLKPSNILIDATGHARVADFGLARGPLGSSDLSLSGELMGTPAYMAPEQAEDPRRVDARADIYSFGATFYHVLTGTPPFQGETTFSVLYKSKVEPLVSPRSRNPALSERMSELLERCLAKSPSDRFSSFAEILRQLEAAPEAPSPWDTIDAAELNPYFELYRSRRDRYLWAPRRTTAHLDTYRFPEGRELQVWVADIVTQHVDAVVSSDLSVLTMDYGVSAAIAAAGGVAVTQIASLLAPVRPGRAVVSPAGRLPARLVIHGITAGFKGTQLIRPSRDLIAEIMASCFYHADTHAVRSIAFPLLGTGGQRFPRDVCLDTMFRFLCRALHYGATSVRDARIVMWE